MKTPAVSKQPGILTRLFENGQTRVSRFANGVSVHMALTYKRLHISSNLFIIDSKYLVVLFTCPILCYPCVIHVFYPMFFTT